MLAWFGLRGQDWHDPLNWVMFVLMAWLLAVASLLPVATLHPQRFGWFDGPGDWVDDDLEGPFR